jgi:hypothetical protein
VILLDFILHNAVNPALLALPRAMDTDAARVQLLATGLQESGFHFRSDKRVGHPYSTGPERGFWRIKRTAIAMLLLHEASRQQLIVLCASRPQRVPLDDTLIHARVEFDDVLSAGVARLIYWADPRPLPLLNAPAAEGWDCYLRNWKPEMPRRETWDSHHRDARAQVML